MSPLAPLVGALNAQCDRPRGTPLLGRSVRHRPRSHSPNLLRGWRRTHLRYQIFSISPKPIAVWGLSFAQWHCADSLLSDLRAGGGPSSWCAHDRPRGCSWPVQQQAARLRSAPGHAGEPWPAELHQEPRTTDRHQRRILLTEYHLEPQNCRTRWRRQMPEFSLWSPAKSRKPDRFCRGLRRPHQH